MSFVFFNDTATTEIYTLSLHDALPILVVAVSSGFASKLIDVQNNEASSWLDRKSTRLNSSHANISYAVFCLKKKQPRSSLPARSTSRRPPHCYGACLILRHSSNSHPSL